MSKFSRSVFLSLSVLLAGCGQVSTTAEGGAASKTTAADQATASVSILPMAAQDFLDSYFKSDTVLRVVPEDDADYSVLLSSGADVDFDRDGEWQKIKLKKNTGRADLASVLPVRAQTYLRENHMQAPIRKITRTRLLQFIVEFSDQQVVSFSRLGKFIPNKARRLPSAAVTFLGSALPADTLEQAFLETDARYLVRMASGIEVQFDRMGRFECATAARKYILPSSLVEMMPKLMVKYVSQNYPGHGFKSINRKSYGYMVKTGKPSSLSICFSKNGDYLRNANDNEAD